MKRFSLAIWLALATIFVAVPAAARPARVTITDLGTLGGSFSQGFGINDQGTVVGLSQTASQERHAFLWQHGVMTDLGTLGGSDSIGMAVNNRDQVVGDSQTASNERDDAFLWQHGVMTDLGTLGGNTSFATAINDKGQVVGFGPTASGETHAFLWQHGVMTDLGFQDGKQRHGLGPGRAARLPVAERRHDRPGPAAGRRRQRRQRD
jgi:probable HAF family extracellular repeat protein